MTRRHPATAPWELKGASKKQSNKWIGSTRHYPDMVSPYRSASIHGLSSFSTTAKTHGRRKSGASGALENARDFSIISPHSFATKKRIQISFETCSYGGTFITT